MAFDLRQAIMTGAYAAHNMAKARREHFDRQQALEKARWQRRMAEDQMELQTQQMERRYAVDMKKLEQDRAALAKQQARLEHDIKKWEEQRDLEGEKLEATKEHQQLTREATKEYRDERLDVMQGQLDVAEHRAETYRLSAEARADYEKAIADRGRVRESSTLIRIYSDIMDSVYKELGDKYKWRNLPPDFIEQVQKQTDELFETKYYKAYAKGLSSEMAMYNAMPTGGPRPESPLGLEDVKVAAGAYDLQIPEEGEPPPETPTEEDFNWVEGALQDQEFLYRLSNGELTKEEYDKLRTVHPEGAANYRQQYGEPGTQEKEALEQIRKRTERPVPKKTTKPRERGGRMPY